MGLSLPSQAFVGSVIPKSKFYGQKKVNTATKRDFIDIIEQIVWQYKLSPKTINISSTQKVSEIQIFRIVLKKPNIPKLAIKVIDKTVQYPVLYEFFHKDAVCYGISLHFAGEDRWYFSDWNAPVTFNFTAQNLERVYQQLITSFITEAPKSTADFASVVANDKERQSLEREISALQNKIRKERQFNKKVELNKRLREKRAELRKLIDK